MKDFIRFLIKTRIEIKERRDTLRRSDYNGSERKQGYHNACLDSLDWDLSCAIWHSPFDTDMTELLLKEEKE